MIDVLLGVDYVNVKQNSTIIDINRTLFITLSDIRINGQNFLYDKETLLIYCENNLIDIALNKTRELLPIGKFKDRNNQDVSDKYYRRNVIWFCASIDTEQFV